ncbi:hypothetical protein T4D_16323 [Trichinella pseudospiralis]|uniref:Uncharacterized protein n=1 Tax=Trichinella pseudospiralis TaxID=6337 RepID=A0A0V1FBA5_TRIPS|nr:hypothetical protein T4D_16323 [Trichinella pseudospiralis]
MEHNGIAIKRWKGQRPVIYPPQLRWPVAEKASKLACVLRTPYATVLRFSFHVDVSGVITGGTLRASKSGKRPHVLVFLLGPDDDLKVELSYCF